MHNQGLCGSCWAHASVAAFSDRKCIVENVSERVQYSEEYLIDCDSMNHGCNGGFINIAHYMLNSIGTTTNECVSFKSENGVSQACPTKCDGSYSITLVRSKDYKNVCATENTIKTALLDGPVATAYDIYEDFEVYSRGIYHHIYGNMIGSHAVEFAGYGEENDVKYWIIKNSWSREWVRMDILGL